MPEWPWHNGGSPENNRLWPSASPQRHIRSQPDQMRRVRDLLFTEAARIFQDLRRDDLRLLLPLKQGAQPDGQLRQSALLLQPVGKLLRKAGSVHKRGVFSQIIAELLQTENPGSFVFSKVYGICAYCPKTENRHSHLCLHSRIIRLIASTSVSGRLSSHARPEEGKNSPMPRSSIRSLYLSRVRAGGRQKIPPGKGRPLRHAGKSHHHFPHFFRLPASDAG